MNKNMGQDTSLLILGFHLKGEIIEVKKGAYGIVYIVDHGKGVIPRYVAFKTINTQLLQKSSSEEVFRQFFHEVQEWFKYGDYHWILHPFYIQSMKELPYVAMPFCATNLRNFINTCNRKSKNTISQILVLFIQISKGLLHAQQKGLVAHQDIKPENILLTDNSNSYNVFSTNVNLEVRVSDFGMANAWKALGFPLGSYPYMAPEQYMPSNSEDFSKVDTFAIGIMLTEALIGRHPCGEKTSKVWSDWNYDKWQSWAYWGSRYIDVGIDEVKALINDCLKVAPSQRPNLKEICETLSDVLIKYNPQMAEVAGQIIRHYDQTYEKYGVFPGSFSRNAIEISKVSKEALDNEIFSLTNRATSLESLNHIDSFNLLDLLDTLEALASLRESRGNEEDKAIDLTTGRKVIDICVKYKNLIRAENILGTDTDVQDIEILADFLRKGINILELVTGTTQFDKVLEELILIDKICASALFFVKASDARVITSEVPYPYDFKSVVNNIDEAIKLNPGEATFWYFKARWYKEWTEIKSVLNHNYPKQYFETKKYEEWLKKAHDINPSWEAPKRLLENIDNVD